MQMGSKMGYFKLPHIDMILIPRISCTKGAITYKEVLNCIEDNQKNEVIHKVK